MKTLMDSLWGSMMDLSSLQVQDDAIPLTAANTIANPKTDARRLSDSVGSTKVRRLAKQEEALQTVDDQSPLKRAWQALEMDLQSGQVTKASREALKAKNSKNASPSTPSKEDIDLILLGMEKLSMGLTSPTAENISKPEVKKELPTTTTPHGEVLVKPMFDLKQALLTESPSSKVTETIVSMQLSEEKPSAPGSRPRDSSTLPLGMRTAPELPKDTIQLSVGYVVQFKGEGDAKFVIACLVLDCALLEPYPVSPEVRKHYLLCNERDIIKSGDSPRTVITDVLQRRALIVLAHFLAAAKLRDHLFDRALGQLRHTITDLDGFEPTSQLLEKWHNDFEQPGYDRVSIGLNDRIHAHLDAYVTKYGKLRDVRGVDELASLSKDTCPICFGEDRNSALVPCGHIVGKECSSRLKECPICRTRIETTQPVYL